MNKLAARALQAFKEEGGGDEGKPSEGKSDKADYASDLETEMEAFAEAVSKKDAAAMAAAFKEAMRLCK
jgi:hypothetical protein